MIMMEYIDVHGQLEYANDGFCICWWPSFKFQYVRVDRMNYAGVEPGGQDPTSEKDNITGHTLKAGFNFNFSDQSNFYMNAGTFSRAPFFNFVFTNYQNIVVDPLENEKAKSLEMGYGFKSRKFSMKINGYITKWEDKGLLSPRVTINGVAPEKVKVISLKSGMMFPSFTAEEASFNIQVPFKRFA